MFNVVCGIWTGSTYYVLPLKRFKCFAGSPSNILWFCDSLASQQGPAFGHSATFETWRCFSQSRSCRWCWSRTPEKSQKNKNLPESSRKHLNQILLLCSKSSKTLHGGEAWEERGRPVVQRIINSPCFAVVFIAGKEKGVKLSFSFQRNWRTQPLESGWTADFVFLCSPGDIFRFCNLTERIKRPFRHDVFLFTSFVQGKFRVCKTYLPPSQQLYDGCGCWKTSFTRYPVVNTPKKRFIWRPKTQDDAKLFGVILQKRPMVFWPHGP